MFILAWTLDTYLNVSQSLDIHVHVGLYKMLCYYITYHITVMYGKFLMIGHYAYGVVRVIVIIVPNLNIISLHSLIHVIIMIKCLFGTTGIAIIWYVCACTCNYISITVLYYYSIYKIQRALELILSYLQRKKSYILHAH